MDAIGIRRIVFVKMLFILVIVGVHANNLLPPSPSPSPLVSSPAQQDIIKNFDLQCYMEWASRCRIYLSPKSKFKWFEGCVDAIKIHCARPLSEVTHN
jgi:hypothetical protein